MNTAPVTAQGILSHPQGDSELAVVCGACSIKGRRPQQEDMIMVHVNSDAGPVACNGEVFVTQGEHHSFSLAGVFDGHGGKRCSRFAAQHMPENFHMAMTEMKSGARDENEVVGPALRLAYRITHEDFVRMARGDGESMRPKTRQRLQDALEKARSFTETHGTNGDGNGLVHRHSIPGVTADASFAAIRNQMLQQRMAMGPKVWDDGSTALCCLVTGNRVFVANAGDSRAVGCIGGKAVPLSVDHKPNLPAERNRIQNAGGTVTSMMGCYRVMGMLAMSRALGDVMIEQYLSQEPDITEQSLSHRDFIVLASDGLWDVISNQEVCQLVSAEAVRVGWSADSLSNIANKVCMEAFRRGSMDNISVLIMMALTKGGGSSKSSNSTDLPSLKGPGKMLRNSSFGKTGPGLEPMKRKEKSDPTRNSMDSNKMQAINRPQQAYGANGRAGASNLGQTLMPPAKRNSLQGAETMKGWAKEGLNRRAVPGKQRLSLSDGVAIGLKGPY